MDAANHVKQDFIDLRVRAEYLDLCGEAEAAARLRKASLEMAREVDLTCYAYQLLWRERVDDAIELLLRNAQKHPDSWNVYHSLAEAYEQKGDIIAALENYEAALRRTTDDQIRQHIEQRLSALSYV